MPKVTLMSRDLKIAAGIRAPLMFNVHANGADGDHFGLDVNVTAILRGAWNAPLRLVGGKIDLDKGSGTAATLPLSEMGSQITMRGSLDGYGTRSLSFTRLGSDTSPLRTWILGAQKRVTFTGVLGVPGAVQSRRMFDGYTRVGTFEDYPPSANVECQDTSLKFANVKLAYNLAPNSGRTRKSIFLELITTYAIPYGEIDFGPNEGGIYSKAVSVGGDQPVLDFLAAWVAPIGRRIHWRDGVLHVRLFDGSGPVQRTLGAADGIRVSIGIPASNDENSVTVSSTVPEYVDTPGKRRTEDIKETRGTYAPLVATAKQDHTTGTISAMSLTSQSIDRVISRTVTRSAYIGTTLITRDVEEWAWYAPKACNKWEDGAGVTSYNPDFDVYQFEDGSWRTEQEEKFRIVRITQMQRTWTETAPYYLRQEVSMIRDYRLHPIPVKSWTRTVALDGSVSFDTPTVVAGYRMDDGNAYLQGKELFLADWHRRLFGVTAADGTISREYIDRRGPTGVVYLQTDAPVAGAPWWQQSGLVLTADTFGPTAAPRYSVSYSGQLSNPDSIGFYWSRGGEEIAYTQIDETSYQRTSTPLAHQPIIEDPAFPQTTPTAVVINGSIPRVDIFGTPSSDPQPTTVTLRDEPRIALAQEVNSSSSNEFALSIAELTTIALEELREKSHVPVTITMPIDWSCYEGKVIVLDYPAVTNKALRLIVWSCNWSLNLATGENEQTLECRYYPPHLAA